MKNLFASASYSFNNFYNNLNTQGQMVFSIIMLLIVILCILLFVTYLVQNIQNKVKINKLKKENKENKEVLKEAKKQNVELESKEPLYNNEKTEIEDIASAIKEALKEEPISLTNFEEDQEKTAIISIDELMQRAKDLDLIEDEEPTGINYLEKYNLEPAEVEAAVLSTTGQNEVKEVKAFKVSQVISPIYGIKKEVINSNDKKA